MASQLRVPPADVTGVQGAVVKRLCKKLLGRVPEPLGVCWHNKRVLRTYLGISGKTRKWSACDEHLKSFAHMAVASLIGCTWCLDFGYFQAHNENLDLDKAREVPRWRDSDVFSPLERDVMEYAEAMSRTPPTVTDELSGRLLRALGAEAFVELNAFIAIANFYTRSNVALGVESEGYAESCGLAPLAAPAPQPSGATG